MQKKSRLIKIRPAGPDHQVVTVASPKADARYCKRPCADCPWRKDATHVFPPEAFVHSAATAYDMATNTFACHNAGADHPAICAGFLMRGADHNLTVRLHRMKGVISDDVSNGGHELHDDYRSMAIANGVDPDEPALNGCR